MGLAPEACCPPEGGFALAPSLGSSEMRIGTREVQLTNLDKVYFPDRNLTKGDLVRDYLEVAECVLPQIRPMQMLRYPDGVDGFNGFLFYQSAFRTLGLEAPQP
jgi:hypothetical protein